MADQDRPNQAANKEKAEGSRPAAGGRGEAMPPPETDTGSGITNRSLDEEVRNQERVPPRGESKEDVERPGTGIER
jgi:hypothetical protein